MSRTQMNVLPLNRGRGKFSFEVRKLVKTVDVGLAILTWPDIVIFTKLEDILRNLQAPKLSPADCHHLPVTGGRRALHLPPLLS